MVDSFGVNDTTLEDGRVRVADGGAHLHDLLDAAGAGSWPVLVVGPPPVADPEQNLRSAALDEDFQRVCACAGVPYVSVLPALLATPVWMRQVAAVDGAHPSSEGYDALAELVWPTWWGWLQTTPAR